MARPIGLPSDPARAGVWRSVTGSPVAADSATLTDTNFPATPDTTTGGAIPFRMESILVAAEFTGGTSPGAELDVLFRDGDAADGSRWKRAGSAITLSSQFQEVAVFGSLVFPRIQNVTGNPTAIMLVIKPGQAQRGHPAFR